MQRLLWEIDGNIAFGPPTVEQLRNAHNLMRDFADEEPLSSQAGNLVALLNAWVPPAGSNLPDMMIALAQKMADENLWEQVSDAAFVGFYCICMEKHTLILLSVQHCRATALRVIAQVVRSGIAPCV